jgi:Na+:H+ antiporter, NhaA family
MTLHGWINDGLMPVFFLLVGLEIKRELLAGELAFFKKQAALPIAGALGGMIVPAAIYWTLNSSGAAAPGWGVAMATDIAFALGALALIAPRAPTGAKVFLAALAIVDDMGAVLVIAIFYSHAIAWSALGGAALMDWRVNRPQHRRRSLVVAIFAHRARPLVFCARVWRPFDGRWRCPRFYNSHAHTNERG